MKVYVVKRVSDGKEDEYRSGVYTDKDKAVAQFFAIARNEMLSSLNPAEWQSMDMAHIGFNRWEASYKRGSYEWNTDESTWDLVRRGTAKHLILLSLSEADL